MKNTGIIFPLMILWAIIWFIITWLYISLGIYDVSHFQEWSYKILHFREKFIELALIIWMFAFWFCIGSTFFWNFSWEKMDHMYGFVPKKWGEDNLQIIEGIGPKIHEVLKRGGIHSFKDLKNASISDLKDILEKWGKQFALANPKTWPEQASFAYNWKWKELKKYQDFLLWGI